MSIPKPLSVAVVRSASAYAQEVDSGRHHLRADEPAERGGTDAGPAPYELLLAGLGACTSITLRMYAERKGWELGKISVSLRFSKDGRDDPGRIEREVRLSGRLQEDQLARLREIVENTPVTKTVKAGAPIT